jgi:hypothetical protein
MTNMAYFLFTFIACLLGVGVGLISHHLLTKAKNLILGAADPFASIANGETTSWDVFAKWQADNNRRFAFQVSGCAAAPLVFAGLAWSERSEVVQQVCGTISKIAGQAYICM